MKSILAVIGLALIFCYACNAPAKKTIAEITDSAVKTAPKQVVVPRKLTFFDSVIAKMELSHEQIKRNTIIDTSRFELWKVSGSDRIPSLEGDTIYYNGKQNKIIVLRYDYRGVCSNKLLLVYRNSKNTAYREVETDCDEDYGSNFDALTYKIVDANTFYTIDTYTEREEGWKKNKVTVTKQFFTITDKGKIKASLPKIMSSKMVEKSQDELE